MLSKDTFAEMDTGVSSAVFLEGDDGKFYRVIKELDDNEPLPNPREYKDRLLGTMVCWNGDYRLGDIQPEDEPIEWLKELLRFNMSGEPFYGKPVYDFLKAGKAEFGRIEVRPNGDWVLSDYAGETEEVLENSITVLEHIPEWFLWDAICELSPDNIMGILHENGFVVLPLYFIDRTSMIGMSTTDYGDRRNSSQVGWIYTSKDRAEKLWCAPWDPERAKAELQDEVSAYNRHLNGSAYVLQVHEFNPRNPDTDIEDAPESDFVEVDSCGGFDEEDPDSMWAFVAGICGEDMDILD